MAIKAADTLKPNSNFAIVEAEDITIKTADGGEERLPDYLARLKGDGAYKSYTDQKIADLVDGAPETLDTLKEIADELAKNETAMEAITAAVQNHTHAEATTERAGFMSAADKASLDSTGSMPVSAYVRTLVMETATNLRNEFLQYTNNQIEYYLNSCYGSDEDFKEAFYSVYKN